MVKQNFFPAAFHMAGLTFFAIFSLMLILLDMASHTLVWRALKFGGVSMALGAFHFFMLTFEREACFFETMIKFCLFPTALDMAALAVCTQTALVFIDLVMTIVTS